MSTLVTYRNEESIATVTMDDGKRNVLSSQMFALIVLSKGLFVGAA